MKTYEVMYIVKPMEDEATEAIITKFQDVITKNGGTIEKTDRWGKKHLAYEIQDLSEGTWRRTTCTRCSSHAMPYAI